MGPPYTEDEDVVILYFMSMGLSNVVVAALAEHKTKISRSLKAIGSRRAKFKTLDGLWHQESEQWDLYAVGMHIATGTCDPTRFKKLIAFGQEEEAIWTVKACKPNNSADALRKMLSQEGLILNEVTRGYYEKWGIAQSA